MQGFSSLRRLFWDTLKNSRTAAAEGPELAGLQQASKSLKDNSELL